MAAKQTTGKLTLTPHFDRLVRDKVASGHYQSASEVINDGLRLLELRDVNHQQALARLKSQIEAGWQASQRDEVVDGPSVFAEIRKISKARRSKPRTGR
jgi:antitoxin ParD1/3/4